MTTTTWTSAPAGFLGAGSVDVRPYSGVVVCPTASAVPGTGLPIGGFAADVRGMTGVEIARLRPENVTAQHVTAQNVTTQQSTQNDDTTLGIHSPGRPQS